MEEIYLSGSNKGRGGERRGGEGRKDMREVGKGRKNLQIPLEFSRVLATQQREIKPTFALCGRPAALARTYMNRLSRTFSKNSAQAAEELSAC